MSSQHPGKLDSTKIARSFPGHTERILVFIPPEEGEETSVAPEEDVPSSIGHYEVESEIGRGGMGVVLRARDTSLGRSVAIKQLPASLCSDPIEMARFQQEARTLALVDHPGVARIYDLQEMDDSIALVLELVEGESLGQVLLRGPLPESQAVMLIEQVARAMSAVHERGIVHRDLKPGNVMIARDGRAKVLDFGLAKAKRRIKSEFDDILDAQEEDELIGTLHYMSPEQVDCADVDARTDVWALGCVLFECLTAKRAIVGITGAELIEGIHEGKARWHLLPEETPEELRELLKSCLQPDPALRPRSMAHVARALEAMRGVRAVSNRPAQPPELSIERSFFVPREREESELAEFLDQGSLISLVGPGGVGKTRLALRAVRARADDMRDGMVMVDLASVSAPEQAVRVLTDALDLREDGQGSLLDTVVSHLADLQMIVLLDNCEHLLGAVVELVRRLMVSCPRVQLVATSRESLNLHGELVYRVPSLDLPPMVPASEVDLAAFSAGQLFLQRARAVNPGLALDDCSLLAAASICHRLDGIPLAIELAAARARLLKIEDISERLGDRFRLLTSGSRTSLPRHQTLKALIDWSYQLLDERERALLRCLSIFSESCNLRAIATVHRGGEVDEFEILDILAGLLDKSLVQVSESEEGTRYRLSESIRQFARDLCAEDGEIKAARDAHLAHYASLVADHAARPGGTGNPAGVIELGMEIENIRDALRWCVIEEGHRVHGLNLLRELFPFLAARGMAREALDDLDDLFPDPDVVTEEIHRLRALVLLGRLQMELGEYTRSRRSFESALAVCAGGPLTQETAMCRVALGNTLWRMGLLEEAEHELQSGIELLDNSDLAMRASALRSLAVVKYRRGDLAGAGDLLTSSVALCRQLDNPQLLSVALQLQAMIEMRTGELRNARFMHEEALELMLQVGYRPGVAMQLINLSNVCRMEGDYLVASRFGERALVLAREIGRRVTITEALGSLGETAMCAGNLTRARRHFEECLEICIDLKDRQGEARARHSLATIAFSRQEPRPALEHLHASITAFQLCGNALELGNAVFTYACALAENGNVERALVISAVAENEWRSLAVTRSHHLLVKADEKLKSWRAKVDAEKVERAALTGAGLALEDVVELIDEELRSRGTPISSTA